jgi:hypothetical protein
MKNHQSYNRFIPSGFSYSKFEIVGMIRSKQTLNKTPKGWHGCNSLRITAWNPEGVIYLSKAQQKAAGCMELYKDLAPDSPP